jgi:hypothetical protein
MISLLLWLLFAAILGCFAWANGDALARMFREWKRLTWARVKVLGQLLWLWRRYGWRLTWRLTCEARRRVSK